MRSLVFFLSLSGLCFAQTPSQVERCRSYKVVPLPSRNPDLDLILTTVGARAETETNETKSVNELICGAEQYLQYAQRNFTYELLKSGWEIGVHFSGPNNRQMAKRFLRLAFFQTIGGNKGNSVDEVMSYVSRGTDVATDLGLTLTESDRRYVLLKLQGLLSSTLSVFSSRYGLEILRLQTLSERNSSSRWMAGELRAVLASAQGTR